jgi:hypothetical protein
VGLKDVLEKMKLVEVEAGGEAPASRPSRPAPPPPPPPPRRAASSPGSPSLDAILRGVPAPPKLDERALPKTPGDEVPDFEGIYKASGIKEPPHGFSAYKVLEILSSPDFAGLDARARAAALSGFLKMNPSGPVPISDVIQDAVARDQALDNFETFLRKKLETRSTELDRETAALQAEIDELTRRNQEKMEVNRRALEGEKQRFAEWQARKRIEERKLFDAVGPFVEQNPVSLGSATEEPPAHGPGPSEG